MMSSMSLESPDDDRRAGRNPGQGDHGPVPSRQRWRILDDPIAIRALAHPVRMDLMSIIGRLGQATTADAARELDISHGLASHHLRQLAKYGFVEQVRGKDNRERPWRLVATSYRWREEASGTPEGAAAAEVLEQVMAERALEAFVRWQQRRKDWPPDWRAHSGIGRSTVYLTEAELAQVTDAIDAVLLPWVEQRPLDDLAARPPGSVPVDFTLFAIPAATNPPATDPPAVNADAANQDAANQDGA